MDNDFKTALLRGGVTAPIKKDHPYVGDPIAIKYQNVTYLLLDIDFKIIELVDIYTPPAKRGMGYARRALGWLMVQARRHNLQVMVDEPVPYAGCPMNEDQLARWFYRRGLKVLGGVHRTGAHK